MDRTTIANSHAKNRKKIKKAITQLNRSLNQAIKENKKDLEYVNIRMIMILYGAYLEATFLYLLYSHESQIKIVSIDYILKQNTMIERWEHYIDFFFRRNLLQGKRKNLNLINLKFTNYSRYNYLQTIISNEIRGIIEIRNKLAHSQWAIAFNSIGDNKNSEVTTKLWTLTKKDVLTTRNIVIRFVEIMEALISSQENFSTVFDDAVGKLEENRIHHEEQYAQILSGIKRKKRRNI